jgi:hypothetical protein
VIGHGLDYQLLRLYVSILKWIGANTKFKLHRSLDDVY